MRGTPRGARPAAGRRDRLATGRCVPARATARWHVGF